MNQKHYDECKKIGATTFSIMTLSIKRLRVTLSIKRFRVTLRKNDTQHNNALHNASDFILNVAFYLLLY